MDLRTLLVLAVPAVALYWSNTRKSVPRHQSLGQEIQPRYPHPDLCDDCAEIHLRSLFLGDEERTALRATWYLHQVYKNTGRNSDSDGNSDSKCLLCHLLKEVIQLNGPRLRDLCSASGSDGRITLNFDKQGHPSLTIHMNGTRLSLRYGIMASSGYRELDDIYSSTRLRVADAAPYANFEILRSWAETCHSGHQSCKPRLADQKPLSFREQGIWKRILPRRFQAPFRLYDCENECIIHVPKSGDEVPEYIALSYVWGEIETAKLTARTKNGWMRKGGLRPSMLPRILHDAIRVTRRLQCRYLWADKLCIMQKDRKDSRDEEEYADSEQGQAFKVMDWIYMNAFCTVVAPEGKDASAQFPGIPGSERVGSQLTATVAGIRLATAVTNPGTPVAESVWLTRPWTFQEMVCSPRTLVFTAEMVLFCCSNGCKREDTGGKITIKKKNAIVLEPIFTFEADLPKGLLTPSYAKKFEDLIRQYICRDRPRKNPEDWNNAVTGILAYLQPILGESVCGNPLEIFHETLGWYSDTYQQRRSNDFKERKLGFPSWSWTGWEFDRDQNTFSFPIGPPALSIFCVSYSDKSKRSSSGPWTCSRIPRPADLQQWHGNFIECHFSGSEADLVRDVNKILEGRYQYRNHPQIIAFYTSAATLDVRLDRREHLVASPMRAGRDGNQEQSHQRNRFRPLETFDRSKNEPHMRRLALPGDDENLTPEFKSFGVWASNHRLATVKLPVWQYPTNEFIVIHCQGEPDRGLRLMMVEGTDILYRIQVTESHVPFKVWRNCVPHSYRRLVLLG